MGEGGGEEGVVGVLQCIHRLSTFTRDKEASLVGQLQPRQGTRLGPRCRRCHHYCRGTPPVWRMCEVTFAISPHPCRLCCRCATTLMFPNDDAVPVKDM